MGFLNVQLGNVNNWSEADVLNLSAQLVGSSSYVPIPKTSGVFRYSSCIIGVHVSSASQSSQRPYAGYIAQNYQTGIPGTAIPNAQAYEARKVYLSRLQVLIFPNISTSYSLLFAPPYYFKDINYTVYEYTGPLTDSTDDLVGSLKNNEIAAINSKLDQLLAR